MTKRTQPLPFRTARALAVAAVLVAACAAGPADVGGSDDSSVSSSTATPATAASTPSDLTTVATTSAPATSTTTTATIVADPSLPTIEQLGELEADGEIDAVQAAVSAFAAIFEVEVEGAIPVSIDAAQSADPSSTIELLNLFRDQLTDTQRRQIDDALSIDLDDAVIVTNADVGPPDLGGVEESTDRSAPITVDVDPQWQGLSGAEPVLPELLLEQLRKAQNFVMGSLGGTVPIFTARFIPAADRTAEQRNWLGWAVTRTSEDEQRTCDMTIVDFPPRSSDGQAQYNTVVHEFFHCWHGQNYSGSVESYWASPGWVKEGLATWVGDQAVPALSDADWWAREFLSPTTARLFHREYSAVGFFWQVGYWGGGNQAVWDRIPAIANSANSTDAYDAAIAGLTLQQAAVLGASSAQRPDLDQNWVFVGPRGTPASREARVLRVDASASIVVGAGGQALTQFEFVPASDGPTIIETSTEGANVITWLGDPERRTVLFPDGATGRWCLNGPCVCEDGTRPFDPIWDLPGDDPRLLVGSTAGTALARYKTSVLSLEAACNPNLDSDLAGEWVADVDAVREAFNEAYSLVGVEVTGVNGEIRMRLEEDGRFVLSYTGVQLNLDDEFIGEIIVDGSGELRWAETENGVKLSGEPDFLLTVDTPQLGGSPIEITGASLGVGESTLTFDADVAGGVLTASNVEGSLAVVDPGEPNVIVFPNMWIRAT